MAEIYLAGGCFWGMEKYLASIRGVLETSVGYANGNTVNPTYEEVCQHDTGHAETVRVAYDPAFVSLDFLLALYYDAIDPVSVNRQGGDVGSQYRTGIYYTDEKDRPVIEHSLAELQKKCDRPVAIEVAALSNYTTAEDYHQKYLDKNPGGYCHIQPQKFRKAKQAMVNPAIYPVPADSELRSMLSPVQYEVTRQNATEPPFRNEFWNDHRAGIYVDITTGEPLFASTDKFESGCGWPSFTRPIDPNVIRERQDGSHGMARTEVRSRSGDAHLGHVFTDGPREKGGLRYCINSAALRFVAKDDMEREGYGYLLKLIKIV